MNKQIPLPTPGEILLHEWLNPMGITQYALAKAIDVPARRINEIIKGTRAITIDTALRLAAFFNTDAQSWINLQTNYDIKQKQSEMQAKLEQISHRQYKQTAHNY